MASTLTVGKMLGNNPTKLNLNETSTVLRMTDDHELMVSVTERETNVTVRNGATVVGTGTTWYGMVDLSGAGNTFPHELTGRIDITAIGLVIDKAGTSQGSLGLGVITRVGASNSDVEIIAGYSFLNNDTTSFAGVFNFAPSQIKCSVANGRTDRIKTPGIITTTAINSGAGSLPYGGTTFSPAVGDLVVQLVLTNNTGFTWAASLQYHSHN